MYCSFFKTPIGTLKIKENKNTITSIRFIEEDYQQQQNLGKRPAIKWVSNYFSSEENIELPKINPEGTEFQKMVWSYISQIPYGKTITYKELAVQIGKPNAVRAVANAIAKNPILILIPCHRIIGSNGDLTGYSGGINRKKWLLQHEVKFQQQTLF